MAPMTHCIVHLACLACMDYMQFGLRYYTPILVLIMHAFCCVCCFVSRSDKRGARGGFSAWDGGSSSSGRGIWGCRGGRH